eukprot:GFUD01018568.1.p1 GENE.GFUD01018568.1~~GFUD01018568.1.p1  ORF type:complete len:440 (-),score=136.50 GFUD01018568.1:115-1434(-)
MDKSKLEQGWDARDGAAKRVVTVLVVGCGQRGQNYAAFALDFPSRMKVVGVAELLAHRRKRMQELYKLEDNKSVKHWEEFLTGEKLADAVIVCTQDQDHKAPAVAFAKLGYHILLEKPMAVTEEDCKEITRACEDSGVMLAVCHVMRYFPPVVKIKEIIDSGAIGDVMTINHTENVGFWHFAHSFVRGNWRNEASSTFSLMAKCCHDMDLIYFWVGEKPATAIQSFGSLQHFKEANQPAGASDRCLSCPVEKSCPYSAQKIYLNPAAKHWPMSVVCDIEDDPANYKQALVAELETGPYGRCVYKCDNDVCDMQMVNIQFQGGAVANLTMTAFTKELCERFTRITGSKGEIKWEGAADGPIVVYDFLTREEKEIKPDLIAPPARTCGHGGADFFLVNAFTKAVANDDPSMISSGPAASLASHMMVFNAEASRLAQNVVKS